ncbi:MAG: HEAT repeat domain-containing protein [Melioribacteraceae bacterium]|nr:HEAT repeat domain-containing protein [Melioribacteraceae bacterium]
MILLFILKSKSEVDLNKKISLEANDEEFWRKLLKSTEPELRSLAIVQLSKILDHEFIPVLVKIYKSDPSYNVRTHALYALAATDSDEFKEILSLFYKGSI